MNVNAAQSAAATRVNVDLQHFMVVLPRAEEGAYDPLRRRSMISLQESTPVRSPASGALSATGRWQHRWLLFRDQVGRRFDPLTLELS
jgi:hypothetical protein